MDKRNTLSNNSLTVIALTNEFCHAIESCSESTRDTFVAQMLKLLPRIYVSMSDVELEVSMNEYYIEPVLDELAYDLARNNVAMVMADEDG